MMMLYIKFPVLQIPANEICQDEKMYYIGNSHEF